MRQSILVALLVGVAACGAPGPATVSGGDGAANAAQPRAAPGGNPFVSTPIATFDKPWAMTFLPDGRMLVTESDGRLQLVSADGSQRKAVTGIPAVDSAGQGGLMDVVLAPDFARSRRVYLSYSAKGPGGKGVVLASGTMTDGANPSLGGVRTLFRASQFVPGNGHYAGRIAFSLDGRYLFFTNGEREKFAPAQDPKSTLGKVLRLLPDGRPAPGNPLAARGFHPAVWSYGHRNLLGIAFDVRGNLWEQEMGPKGGDEVNLILPGRNYGYPNVSNGDHYDGRDIPDHRQGDGYEAPQVSWNPVISPGGLMIYSGNLFPQWKGSAFIGGLSSEALVRVVPQRNPRRKGRPIPDGQPHPRSRAGTRGRDLCARGRRQRAIAEADAAGVIRVRPG